MAPDTHDLTNLLTSDGDAGETSPSTRRARVFTASATTDPKRRRWRSPVLVAAAVFALTLAVALPTVVYPRLAVLPRDPGRTSFQEATGATVLMPDPDAPGRARVLRDVPVRVSTHVAAADGSASQSLGDSVVWNIATRIDVPGHGMVSARVETVSLNRHTAEPTNCCGDRLVTSILEPGGEMLSHRGFLAFPFNVAKRAYPVWDVTLRRARIAKFIGEEKFAGLRTYKFQAATPLVGVGTRDLPGPLFGLKDGSVPARFQYANTRTYWVEPVTGAVVSTQDDVTQEYRYGEQVVTAMSASLKTEPPSQTTVSQLRTGAQLMPWVRWRASLVLAAIAAILLPIAFRSRRATTDH